jgi:hypothetical protein
MDNTGPSQTRLPPFFKPILWSYNFAALDPETHKKAISGDLSHWQWIIAYYGKGTI